MENFVEEFKNLLTNPLNIIDQNFEKYLKNGDNNIQNYIEIIKKEFQNILKEHEKQVILNLKKDSCC
jgi:translation elongation factor EF-G